MVKGWKMGAGSWKFVRILKLPYSFNPISAGLICLAGRWVMETVSFVFFKRPGSYTHFLPHWYGDV